MRIYSKDYIDLLQAITARCLRNTLQGVRPTARIVDGGFFRDSGTSHRHFISLPRPRTIHNHTKKLSMLFIFVIHARLFSDYVGSSAGLGQALQLLPTLHRIWYDIGMPTFLSQSMLGNSSLSLNTSQSA